MRKLSRGQLRAFALGQLRKQGGICPLCNTPISMLVKGNKSDYVTDHDHVTGEVRGVLHRSCNAAEGKVANAAGRWGAKSMQSAVVAEWLDRLLTYWEQPGLGVIYPGHLTPEEQADKARLAKNKAAALRRAKLKVKESA